MSMRCFADSRWEVAFAILGIACLFLFGVASAEPPSGKDPGLLDETRQRSNVAAQKMEATVASALRDAERLSVAEPDKAVAFLRNALGQLDKDSSLPDSRRAVLQRVLKDRLRVMELNGENTPSPTQDRTGKRGSATSEEDRVTDSVTIQRLRDEIRKWQKENSPAAQATEQTHSLNKQLADNRQLRQEREQRTNNVLRDVDRSGLPPKSDYELPKDWKTRTQDRKRNSEVPLTTKEKAILRTLDSTISVRFRNSRFEDVIEYLHTTLGLPILVDKNALEAAGVTYETAITLEVKSVTVRSLLRRLLNDFGLAYVIKEEAVQIVTPQQAKESMVVRTYPIGDLIRPTDPAFLLLPPEFRRRKMLENVAQLIDLIQSTVDSQNWRASGGPATITFHELTMSLVIKAPTELHPVLSSGLK